tara:strand:- start:959 stop:1297 length:339 start_codon:yes stop_codon:yes gene_type:complete
MAFTGYHNVTGSSGVHVELLAPGDNAGSIKSMMLTNVHASNDATVSLSIAKLSSSSITSAETYYILHTVAIPADTSLLLDDSDILTFNNSVNGYSLFITVGSSDTVDVIIKK